VFTDAGPLDVARDPGRMGRGLISHGSVAIHGDAITPFVKLAKAPRKETQSYCWSRSQRTGPIGDRLVLPAVMVSIAAGRGADRPGDRRPGSHRAGADAGPRSASGDWSAAAPRSPRKTKAGRGTVVLPTPELSVPLANLTRTVILTSANPAVRSRRARDVHARAERQPGVRRVSSISAALTRSAASMTRARTPTAS
jgi:hypothetical protein